jgi:hypothetical protein
VHYWNNNRSYSIARVYTPGTSEQRYVAARLASVTVAYAALSPVFKNYSRGVGIFVGFAFVKSCVDRRVIIKLSGEEVPKLAVVSNNKISRWKKKCKHPHRPALSK